jgi:protease-4
MIFALVLLALLVIGFMIVSTTFVGSLLRFEAPYAHTTGPRLEEVLLEDNDASAKVAVVELDGIITSAIVDPAGFNLVDVIKAQLKRAAEDTRVKAVVLKVDSPGGEVLASDEINKAIAGFQKTSGKPVVAALGNLAASGGYYVAVSSRWIVANEMTLTGSIGVIMSAWNYRGLMNKVGVRPYTYKSGKFKDMLSGSREPEEIPAEERKMLQALIDEVYRQFKSVVADGREAANKKNAAAGQTLSRDWETYADGRVLSGSEAFKLGFVDELGNFDLAVARARKLAGISNANLVRYQRRIDLADLFRFLGKSEARSVKVDLGIEFPKLNAGQFYFLPPTYVH